MADDDRALVRQTLNGQLPAFGVLVERYSGLVYALVLERVRRPDQAEDLVQETFCAAYQALPGLRRPARFAPWLAQIARHTALRWVRQEQTRSRIEGGHLGWAWTPEAATPPDEETERRERLGALWAALDQLPENLRQLVVLHHLEGCSVREVARFLGLPATTVHWRLRRAERQLGQQVARSLGSQLPSPPVDRKRMRRQVLAALAGGTLVRPQAEAASVGVLGWLGKVSWPGVVPAALAVGGLGSAGLYLTGDHWAYLTGALTGRPAVQQTPAAPAGREGVRIELSTSGTTAPVVDGVFVRHQVAPPPLAMDVPAASAGEAGPPALPVPSAAGSGSADAASAPPIRAAPAGSSAPVVDVRRTALVLLFEQLRQTETAPLSRLIQRIGDEVGIAEGEVRQRLSEALQSLETERRSQGECWARLVVAGGQEVPQDRAERLLRNLVKEAQTAFGRQGDTRVDALVFRAAQKSGVTPLLAIAFLRRLLAGELGVPGEAAPAVPRSGQMEWVADWGTIVGGRSTYPVEPMLQELDREPDPGNNPLVLYFGAQDPVFIRGQISEVHRGVLRYMPGFRPVSGVNELPARQQAVEGVPPEASYTKVSFEVTSLDFAIAPGQQREDGKPVVTAVMKLRVVVEPAWFDPSAHRPPPRARSLVVRMAGPRSGGRNTLDGLCGEAAAEIRQYVWQPLREGD